MKHTKIICTIGPSSSSKLVLINLLKAGMDIMRVNLSHGNYLEHKKNILNLRKAIKVTGKTCSIMLDTKGPEIRTMKLINSLPVKLVKNNIFTLTINKNIIGNEKIVAISYTNLIKYIKINNIILIDDGLIGLKIINFNEEIIKCLILNNGLLGENKSINIPGINIPLPFLNNKDKKDIIFACKTNIDFIAASFVKTKEDILQIKTLLKVNNKNDIKVIAKIENVQALNNLDDIINYSDGIMIARGDLGVEIPLEKLVIKQKQIIKRCKELGKSVITATQMLNSMIYQPRPTRAEISDVTNAVLDGTDAVMLSAETANGYYPLESVQIMNKICLITEKYILKNTNIYSIFQNYSINFDIKEMSEQKLIWLGYLFIAYNLNATIIVFTSDGESVNFFRKYCNNNIILAISQIIIKPLILMKGVINYNKFYFCSYYILSDYLKKAKQISKELDIVKDGDWVLIFFDFKFLKTINTNLVSIQKMYNV